MMDVDTLAEVIVNLQYDPSNRAHWDQARLEAEEALAAAARGDIEPWWEKDS